MTQAAIRQTPSRAQSEHHTELNLSHGQWRILNKLLRKSSDCYGESLAPGISQQKVAQLRQRCREYCKNILHIYPQCADALALLSRIALDCNELRKAKKFIRQALQYAPNASVCWFSLGHVYLAENEHEKARECFQKTVKLEPSHFRAKAAYAYSCFHQGEIVSAFNIYKRLIHQNPDDPHVKSNLFACLKQLTADTDTPELDEQLRFYLGLEDVDHSDLSRLIASLLAHRYQLSDKNSQVDIAQLSKDTLYLQALKVVIFSSDLIEDLNSSVRQHLLFARRCNLDELNLKICLAIQAFNNEHVMAYDDSERLVLEGRIQQSELILQHKELDQQQQLTLLDNWVSLVMYEPSSCFPSLYNGAMLNHMIDTASAINTGGALLTNLGQLLKLCFSQAEKEIRIESLGTISDSVSCRVKAQYEENPYPRWLALPYQTPTEYQQALDTALPEHGFVPKQQGQTLQVLVAGSGTGKHALQCARYFRNTQVTAIDISHASLAYAKVKADQYQLNNIEFLQADILELQNIKKRFDIIECSGVLHHMNSPQEGARVLKQLLRPGGIMKIGLYSERARSEVVMCREMIAEQQLQSRPKDMRELRRQILSRPEQWPAVLSSPDFYSLSGCRDLLFHEQEHRFTPLQIEAFCEDLDMEFLGFVRVPAKHYQTYRKTYPLDERMRNLGYWEAYEERNPLTFGGMYQFYVRN
ncbi:methyltransferase domain-containing protein [Pseudoteredinibacter isoporae]|uniref:2-polyprenyl-3-methyl-5-hydroxy-6-metoxy-1, 4-benzoquinol methylase/Tfp pilus assembly protein PilF n=1 Tax=Pseudoteredinibacter isoporae TaxID=570281 RepID=A0A7X0MXG7_9GAMM|nr:2-polyprenyl-3-methyl-5-hydroxy-6-metoxy-1,4-benzoquinol methylase/Tfp pilus assembly protein PilF [Pseudoteredinibacter isoporae]NHO88997.1 methyltransferase domain-containing protein [Pseudoteredinibacter isoporae]NIB24295.1 methyltransferase domain-containing protein [Pseudoteredinibacter isoporae]